MNTETFKSFDNNSHERFTTRSVIEKDLQTLTGILDGINADKQIKPEELIALHRWMTSTEAKRGMYPYTSLHLLIPQALEDNILTDEEIEGIKYVCEQFIDLTGYFSVATGALQRLEGIVSGIIADNVLNEKEIRFLDEWIDNNSVLKNSWPYDELSSFVTSILSDGIITDKERLDFLAFCKSIYGNSPYVENSEIEESFKQGFCQIDPEIIIQEKNFCITGVSAKNTRQELAKTIELYGGFMVDTISKNLHYLIVCDKQSACWAYTCYGRKIEKAIQYRKQGIPIAIVHENDLYDLIESLQ